MLFQEIIVGEEGIPVAEDGITESLRRQVIDRCKIK